MITVIKLIAISFLLHDQQKAVAMGYQKGYIDGIRLHLNSDNEVIVSTLT